MEQSYIDQAHALGMATCSKATMYAHGSMCAQESNLSGGILKFVLL